MLRFASTDSAPLEIQVTITKPTLYLDYCVLVDLAENVCLGGQVREVLQRADGTLFLSWAHIVELFALGNGPTFERFADYLETFGRRFAIIEADPHTVIKREQLWTPGHQNPALDEDFMRMLLEHWDGQCEMSPGILLNAVVKEPEFFTKIKDLHQKQKANVKQLFDKERERYRADSHVRQLLNNACYPYSTGTFMTDKVMKELTRECVRTNEQFNPTDVLDFFHAVVSVSYCTHVVFDKKWASRCGKVGLPASAAFVLDGTQMNELLAALEPSLPDFPVIVTA